MLTRNAQPACLAERRVCLRAGCTEKANRRFPAQALAALGRICARLTASKIAEDGLRLVVGAGAVGESEMGPFEAALGLAAIHRAQAGLLSDMDYIADVLYGRAAAPAKFSA